MRHISYQIMSSIDNLDKTSAQAKKVGFFRIDSGKNLAKSKISQKVPPKN